MKKDLSQRAASVLKGLSAIKARIDGGELMTRAFASPEAREHIGSVAMGRRYWLAVRHSPESEWPVIVEAILQRPGSRTSRKMFQPGPVAQSLLKDVNLHDRTLNLSALHGTLIIAVRNRGEVFPDIRWFYKYVARVRDGSIPEIADR